MDQQTAASPSDSRDHWPSPTSLCCPLMGTFSWPGWRSPSIVFPTGCLMWGVAWLTPQLAPVHSFPSSPIMSLTTLTDKVETKSKPNWLITQGTNPAEQLRREFSSAGIWSTCGCWDWLIVNPLDREMCVKYSIFSGFRSVKSGIQSKAPPSLLSLTGVGCDQAAPAEKFPSMFTWFDFHPVLFASAAWRGSASIQRVIWTQEATPGCWCKSAEVLKVLFLQETPPVNSNFLYVFILPSVLNSFPSLRCFRQDTWILWLFPSPWLGCLPWWWEWWWLRGVKLHGQKWKFLLSLKLEVKKFP